MVCMRVAAGDQVEISNRCKSRRIDNAFSNANMRLVGAGGFSGERIGAVRIENDRSSTTDYQKAALTEPPKTGCVTCEPGLDFGDELFVFLKGLFYLDVRG